MSDSKQIVHLLADKCQVFLSLIMAIYDVVTNPRQLGPTNRIVIDSNPDFNNSSLIQNPTSKLDSD